MTVWTSFTGAIKDTGCICLAKISPTSVHHRKTNLQTAVIKATSHDEHHIDYNNVERIMQFLAASPSHFNPLLLSLTSRVNHTRSWPVALKSLMLLHGVFCCDIPDLRKIHRLPFDLSDFTDRRSKSEKIWCFNAFVRSYFTYLDHRSVFVSSQYNQKRLVKQQGKEEVEDVLMSDLEKLRKMQALIDTMLEIRPRNVRMNRVALVLEALDCVVVELCDMYGKLCGELCRVVLRIYDVGGKVEACEGLRVVKKAAVQGDELADYFELCRELGVVHSSRSPQIEPIPEENIRTLERMANGDDHYGHQVVEVNNNEEKAMVLVSPNNNGSSAGTVIISEKWEVFDDDEEHNASFTDGTSSSMVMSSTNPFLDDSLRIVPCNPPHNQALPDLITF